MKTTLKVLLSMFALGFIMLVGLHIFLQYGLTKAMRAVVLPRILEETGIDVEVRKLSLNVPGGILYLDGVSVKNPPGYPLEHLATIDRIYVEVDSASLLMQKSILVHKVQMENALVNVIRTKEGVLNVDEIQAGLPEPGTAPEGGIPAPETEMPEPQEPGTVPKDGPGAPEPTTPETIEPEALPEMLIETLLCNARVRYLDMNYKNLDIVLDLSASGKGLSTQQAPNARWGMLELTGSLGNDKSSFQTDLLLKLAPVVYPQTPSFDLSGQVMRIDPRIMEEVYSKMGIRCAPFAIEPQIHCRAGEFKESVIGLELVEVELEDKLSRRLGGMATIGSLKLDIPLSGTLQEPETDLVGAFYSSLGGNAKTMLDSLLRGAAGKEVGLDQPPEDLTEAAVELLGKHVNEIGESEAAQQILKDLAGGGASATNGSPTVNTDELIDLLGDEIDEIGENEDLKKSLKSLGKALFGN